MALRITIALVLAAVWLPIAAEPTANGSSATTPITATLTTEHSAEAQEVIDRFTEIGLELPTVTIEFHETTTACHGHDGFIRYAEPAPVITICSDLPYVLPHELAHAWVDANLTESAKADYVERWGLASWDDSNDHRNDRGTEHAAFVIQQNLTVDSPRLTRTWRDRAEAFDQLTGIESPLLAGSAA